MTQVVMSDKLKQITFLCHPIDHANIKAAAALQGKSIKEYMLEAVAEKILKDKEEKKCL